MSDKYPALDTSDNDDVLVGDGTDFLKREAEALGDEFQTEQDKQLLDGSVDEDLETANEETKQEDHEIISNKEVVEENFGDSDLPQQSHNDDNINNSEIISKWKQRRADEIDNIETKITAEKKDLEEQAVKHIDDFYDNYNRRKQQQLEVTKKEAEEFMKQRSQFFQQQNTTWDRVIQLINEDDADIISDRDRSAFKEILLRLKGKTNVPGA